MDTRRFFTLDNENYVDGNVLYLVVHGTPKPQERPRIRILRQSPRIKKGKSDKKDSSNKRVFSPSTANQRYFRSAVSEALNKFYTGTLPVFGRRPVEMSVTFFFKRPINHFHSGRRDINHLKRQFEDEPPVGTGGDIDNHVKLVLDSVQKLLFHDDKQVIELNIKKRFAYGLDDRTEIKISSGDYEISNENYCSDVEVLCVSRI